MDSFNLAFSPDSSLATSKMGNPPRLRWASSRWNSNSLDATTTILNSHFNLTKVGARKEVLPEDDGARSTLESVMNLDPGIDKSIRFFDKPVTNLLCLSHPKGPSPEPFISKKASAALTGLPSDKVTRPTSSPAPIYLEGNCEVRIASVHSSKHSASSKEVIVPEKKSVFRKIIELSQQNKRDPSKSPFENDLSYIFDAKDIENINNANSIKQSLASQNLLANHYDVKLCKTSKRGKGYGAYKRKRKPNPINSFSSASNIFNGIVVGTVPRSSSKLSHHSSVNDQQRILATSQMRASGLSHQDGEKGLGGSKHGRPNSSMLGQRLQNDIDNSLLKDKALFNSLNPSMTPAKSSKPPPVNLIIDKVIKKDEQKFSSLNQFFKEQMSFRKQKLKIKLKKKIAVRQPKQVVKKKPKLEPKVHTAASLMDQRTGMTLHRETLSQEVFKSGEHSKRFSDSNRFDKRTLNSKKHLTSFEAKERLLSQRMFQKESNCKYTPGRSQKLSPGRINPHPSEHHLSGEKRYNVQSNQDLAVVDSVIERGEKADETTCKSKTFVLSDKNSDTLSPLKPDEKVSQNIRPSDSGPVGGDYRDRSSASFGFHKGLRTEVGPRRANLRYHGVAQSLDISRAPSKQEAIHIQRPYSSKKSLGQGPSQPREPLSLIEAAPESLNNSMVRSSIVSRGVGQMMTIVASPTEAKPPKEQKRSSILHMNSALIRTRLQSTQAHRLQARQARPSKKPPLNKQNFVVTRVKSRPEGGGSSFAGSMVEYHVEEPTFVQPVFWPPTLIIGTAQPENEVSLILTHTNMNSGYNTINEASLAQSTGKGQPRFSRTHMPPRLQEEAGKRNQVYWKQKKQASQSGTSKVSLSSQW